MFCWHKWNKWSDPVNGIAENTSHSTGYFRVVQLRTCAKCGKAETRSIPKMRSIESLRNEK